MYMYIICIAHYLRRYRPPCVLLLSYMYITRRTPLATFMDFKSDILDMDLDEDRWLWVTVGSDKIVKVCVCVCV